MIQQALFVITLGVAIYFIRKRVLRLWANIKLGKDRVINDQPGVSSIVK
jgi:hypothetical protein